jgi:hypothetical protein
VTHLLQLHLESLKQFAELPPLHSLTRLRRVTLWTMKGCADLSVLLTAPAMEEIVHTVVHISRSTAPVWKVRWRGNPSTRSDVLAGLLALSARE